MDSLQSSSFSSSFTYEVFLSFRGEDTRYNFTGNLYDALFRRGIHTFMDEEDLQKGEEITPSLLKAIEGSRIAIIVLSKNYASSSFCLDELSNILDSIKGKGRLVLPVFYDVDPSHVRKLTGTYGEAIAKHEERFKDDIQRLQNWKMALHKVANLSGWHFKLGDGYEHKFIAKIVEQVSREIKPITLAVHNHLVGLETKKQHVTSLLDVGSDDKVHIVGIHGIGGIGKTTLARAVYNSVADHFEGMCFLENVRENSKKDGLPHIQNIILSEIVGEKEIKLTNVKQGISIIQQRLQRKKILLILDDVDKREQLEALAERQCFGPGSRVIITTRDKHLLTYHEVESTYEVKELNKKDAFELLKWKAFKTDKVCSSYLDILNRAVTYASGLPLALEVIGSHLFKKSVEEWESALDRYERIPNNEIQNILKVSFDALDQSEKSVFLDIACCFKGYRLEKVEGILYAHYGESKKHHIGVLVEKSIIKIEFGCVTLHDLIEDMGKEIVRQESPENPGKRSRLWFSNDIIQVLEKNSGTDKIEIIHMNYSPVEIKWDGEALKKMENLIKWDGEALKKMENLRTLIVRDGGFSENPKYLPKCLRVLEWRSRNLPFDFHMMMKKFEDMRVLNIYDCELRQIPDISGLPNLEEFSFEYWNNLTEIHKSVGLLGKLKILSAQGCSKLRSFPPLELPSLEQLNLSDCYSLESFPLGLGLLGKLKILRASYFDKLKSFPPLELTSLEQLYLSYCDNLESISPMVGSLDKLKILDATRCKKLRSFPPLKLPSLEELHLSDCSSLENFPEILGKMENVTHLHLQNTPIKELPYSFQNLTRLQTLYMKECGMDQLPSSIVMMSELTKLTIRDGGWLFPKQDKGGEKVSPMHSSKVEFLQLLNCNLSDESLAIGFKWFANVKELDLSGSQFTVLPECIKEWAFLQNLSLDNCWELQEIRGIPRSLKTFSALNCQSLASSLKSELLNQELHEAGNTSFRLPRVWIPKWFDHRCMQGLSISFWFRNKLPAIVLCVVSPLTWLYSRISVTINGNKFSYRVAKNKYSPEMYHLHLFHMQLEKIDDNLDKALLENKWNHMEVDFTFPFQQSGIHVLKEKSSMEDIRFTDPENDVNTELAL